MNLATILLLLQLLRCFGTLYETTKQLRTLVVSKIHAVTDHNYRKQFAL